MMGVEKNHSVSRLASRSLMSRKCTVRAASTIAKPSVRMNCTKTTNGNQTNSVRTGNPMTGTRSIMTPKRLKCSGTA